MGSALLLGLTLISPPVAAGDSPGAQRANWPMFRGDVAQTGVAHGTLGDRFELAWTFKTEGAITSSPVVVDGTVFFGSDDGFLYAVDLETGAKRWAFKTDDIIEAPALVHDDLVYIGSSDFFFYAVSRQTGEVAWKYETNDKVLGGASWVPRDGQEDVIVVGSYDASVYGFGAKSGELLWKYTTDNYVNGTPAIWNDRIIFGGCDSALHTVSAVTGEGSSKVELCPECHIAGSVGVRDGRAYFGHYGNAFVCIDLETGETLWDYGNERHPFFSSPAIGDERIVFGGRDKHLHCAKRSDGTPLWKFKTRRKVDGSPVLCDDKVVFGSGDGFVYVLALETGELLWSYEIGSSIFSSPAVAGGRILIGANDKSLYAFGPDSE